MNEEEKEAIENIKGLETLFEIDDKKDFEATPLAQKEIAKDLKILLNLIDKMKNCINILDNELKERNKTINEKEILIEKQQKEIERRKHENKTLKNFVSAILNEKFEDEYISKREVKDKIEEILNNGEYRIIFEGNTEIPDEATIINAHKYIKLEKLQELLEGRK